MKIESVNFGEILAWIVMILLFSTKVISSDTFILFVAIKFTLKVSWKE